MYEIVSYLGLYGLGESVALKVFEHFMDTGKDPIEQIELNPYVLTNVDGIGFKTADKLALALGLTHDDPKRLTAALLFELDENGVLDDASGKLSAEERLAVQKAAQAMPVEKKELAPTTKIQAIEKTPPVVEKVVKHHSVAVEEKKPEVVVAPAKNVKPTVNPWTRTPNFVPSNLISTPPVKTSN